MTRKEAPASLMGICCGDRFDPITRDQFVPLWQWMHAVPDPVRWFTSLSGSVENVLCLEQGGVEVPGQGRDDGANRIDFATPRLPLGFHSCYGQDERFE